ncbi:MAG: CBS domain-containing protein [Candidatus Aenigmatarchaeota archaeon]
MLVRKVMRRKVITVKEEDTLHDVLKKFVKHNISGMPVVRDKKVVGIVTESDVIRAIDAFLPKIHYDTATGFAVILSALKHGSCFEAARKDIIRTGKLKVKDFMKKKVITIRADDDLGTAARIMTRHKVKRLPVVKNKKLVGIIARADLIRALGK